MGTIGPIQHSAMAFGVSIVAALGAATGFAGAAVLQQESARDAPEDASLSPRLLLILLRRPRWLAGVALLLVGYGLQAVALANGPVAVVQPLVATELAIAIPLAIWRGHRRAGRREWLGIAAVLSGVATFLVVASPVAGIPQPSPGDWVLILIGLGVPVGLLLMAAVRIRGPLRATLLGAAAGLAFALVAVLTKAVTHQVGEGAAATFGGWQVYALVAVGIGALVVSQSAYQSGPLAMSMPAIALLEPMSAVVIGAVALDEQARLGGAALAVEGLAAAVASVGIVVLATSRVVLDLYERPRPARAGDRQE